MRINRRQQNKPTALDVILCTWQDGRWLLIRVYTPGPICVLKMSSRARSIRPISKAVRRQ